VRLRGARYVHVGSIIICGDPGRIVYVGKYEAVPRAVSRFVGYTFALVIDPGAIVGLVEYTFR